MNRGRRPARRAAAAARAAGVLAGLGLLTSAWAAGVAPADGLFPLSDIRPGLRGEAVTVYQGESRERVPLEILGVAPGFLGPGRDLILARLEGEHAEQAGVVAGMSGSPVFVDGRLVGALSLRIGAFTREAIAGITPIEQMLALESAPPAPGDAFSLDADRRYPTAALLGLQAWPAEESPKPLPAVTPLAVGGLPQAVLDLFAPVLAAHGLGPWVPAVAGSMAGSEVSAQPLQAGDPVAAVLVRGDITLAGTGTVTMVNGGSVLAMGHPLLQAGAVDLPMARAEILLTVPSLAGSFKMSRVGEVVGAFRQDRSPGLAGRLGEEARMLPVTVRLSGPGEASPRTLRYEIVRTAGLSPVLLEMALVGTFLSHDQGGLGGTIALGGRIEMEGASPVVLDTVITGGPGGPPAVMLAARHAAALYRILSSASGSEARDFELNLEVGLDPEVRLLLLEEARLDRPWARAGETVTVTAWLRDAVSGARMRQELTWTVPDLPTGSLLQVVVGDAATVSRAEGEIQLAELQQTSDPVRLARILGGLRSSRGLYLQVGRQAAGLVIGATAMPDLPPSVLGTLERDGTSRSTSVLAGAVLHEQHRDMQAVISGGVSLNLEVR